MEIPLLGVSALGAYRHAGIEAAFFLRWKRTSSASKVFGTVKV